jgi:hypothetical protein
MASESETVASPSATIVRQPPEGKSQKKKLHWQTITEEKAKKQIKM